MRSEHEDPEQPAEEQEHKPNTRERLDKLEAAVAQIAKHLGIPFDAH